MTKTISKLIIAGSRDIEDYYLLEAVLRMSPFNMADVQEIVSGCAKGVDSLGERHGVINKIDIKRFPADWNKHGKSAGPIRNGMMAEYGDAAIVITNGSKGSANMIKQMISSGKPLYVVRLESINV